MPNYILFLVLTDSLTLIFILGLQVPATVRPGQLIHFVIHGTTRRGMTDPLASKTGVLCN